MSLVEELKKDIRIVEGLNACINCGTCTAVCPAAAVVDYDPRIIVNTVQKWNEQEIETLLKSDDIWQCGECLSCKSRCPRDNTPCYIVQALRALSIEKGYFIESNQGRKQLAVKRTVGDHILQYGYCVYFDEVDTDMYPEQGPIWDWMQKNKNDILERLGASYKKDIAGGLRNTSEESLSDLRKIFVETGGLQRMGKIETFSKAYAQNNGISFNDGKDVYFKKQYEE